jgi:putative tricarboxylic transport membrane protein
MRKLDLLTSIILFIFSLFVFILSMKYQTWIKDEPGEGFFPTFLSLTLMGLSIIGFINTYRGRRQRVQIDGAGAKIIWKKLLSYIGALFVYAFFLDYLGFIASSLIVLVFILHVAEGMGWLRSFIISTTTLIITYFVFQKWLMISLPRGIL